MNNNLEFSEAIVCVVGLGYVGWPLAKCFSKTLKVIGFDSDSRKVQKLSKDANQNLLVTNQASDIAKADFIIICVPTPVTKSKEPDLSYIVKAARVIGRNMKKGSVVTMESTVYPGVTEEVLKPILEEYSSLKCGVDFRIGYSPERINPGDELHTLENITKVVAGMDETSTELLVKLYSMVSNNIFRAQNIKTAEAAKVIENIQRDLNIALMNELSIIFTKLGLNTRDVLDAAATKWNFHRYFPGLVGGHCIPVDPYYLVHKAKELGYHPQVTLAGRAINDYMPKHIVEMTVKALNDNDKVIKNSKVLIMGLTYKENVADTREAPVREIIHGLEEYGVTIFGYDPLLNDFPNEYKLQLIHNLEDLPEIDCVIITVAHDNFLDITLNHLKQLMGSHPVIIDIRGMFNYEEASSVGIYYRCL